MALLVVTDCRFQVISCFVDGYHTSNIGSRTRKGTHGHGWLFYHRYYFPNLIDAQIDSRMDDCDLVRDSEHIIY